jgi:hypothetical protein
MAVPVNRQAVDARRFRSRQMVIDDRNRCHTHSPYLMTDLAFTPRVAQRNSSELFPVSDVISQSSNRHLGAILFARWYAIKCFGDLADCDFGTLRQAAALNKLNQH